MEVVRGVFLEIPMSLEPDRYADGRYPAAGGQRWRGNLRASTADRERAVDVIKAAFSEGRLTREEFEERTARAYRSLTYAELDQLTADLPVGPLGTLAPPPAVMPQPGYPVYAPRPPLNSLAVAALICSLIPGVPMVGGLVAGLVARKQIETSGERGDSLARAAIVIGGLGALAMALWVIAFTFH